jgi:hypothetical protein
MTKATRYLLVSAVLMTGLAGAARMAEAADEPASTGSVRSSSPAIRTLIVQATEQSATFRRMVETIDASESVVYVEVGTCGRGMRACFVNVTGARAHRFPQGRPGCDGIDRSRTAAHDRGVERACGN